MGFNATDRDTPALKPRAMFRYLGLDEQGVRRVFGTGNTPDEARDQCERAAHEYCRGRPDMWDQCWWFKRDYEFESR